MSKLTLKTTLWLGVFVLSMLHQTANAQAFTEIRDPLRGVTLYSAQISSDPTTSLQAAGSVFSSSDRMTLGFSAFFFDESDAVDEYVMWLRHDGPRRWFASERERPLKLYIDDEELELALQHSTRPASEATSGPLVEKKEFVLTPDMFESLLTADEVSVELVTSLGVVVKELNDGEQAAISRFKEIVLRRHSEIVSSLGSEGA